jgi:hypothetical protein
MALSMHGSPPTPQKLSSPEILRIAHADAERAYGDLSPYRITLSLHPDGWHVDYELEDPLTAGGGPHYVIDAVSGAIVEKHYDQ